MRIRFEFEDGRESLETEAYEQLNLLAHAQILCTSLQSRCGGHCECGTCRIKLIEGRLSQARSQETELLNSVGASPEYRLACQSFPEVTNPVSDSGLIVIHVPKKVFKDARGQKRRK